MSRLLRVAVLAAAGDAVTKSVAALWLGGSRWGGHWVGLGLVHNDRGAFGLTVGTYTWEINLALTMCALALVLPVCRALERVDLLAPEALGLVAGGALGNLASLVLSPFGVLDFIALRVSADGSIVLNAADIAAYAGLAMLGRTLVRIVIALRDPAAGAALALDAVRSPVREAEVARVVWVEPGADRRPEPSDRDEPREHPAPRRPPRQEPRSERTVR